MRDVTIEDLDAELAEQLPARELMGCAPRSSSFSYTSITGSGDGNNEHGLSLLDGSFDGDSVYL